MKHTHTLFKITTFIVFLFLFTAKMGAQVPANDLCANAIPLAVPVTTTGTTVNATVENPLPPTCVATQNTMIGVWYTITGTGNLIGASLCGNGWDSEIFIYSGSSCGALTCVTADDDNGPLCSGSNASAMWCSQVGVNYYIFVTGWSSTSAFSLAITQTVGAVPTVTASASSTLVCPGKTTSLTATGTAATYSWSSGSTSTLTAPTVASATTYSLYAKDATGCYSNSTSISVSTYSAAAISVNSGSICPGGTFTFTPSGANTYTYNGSSSNTITTIVAANYTVAGTDGNGCVSPTVTSSIGIFQTPTVSIASPTGICVGSGTSFTATGATTYTWNGTTTGSVYAVTPSSTTVYTVVATGTTVCNAVKTVTLAVNPSPTITVNSGTLCAGKVFTMSPGGAITYTYSNGSNTISPATNTAINVSGTSAFGCASTVSAVSNITIVALPVVSVNSGTICNGSIFVMTPSGAASYSFVNTANPASPSVTTTYSVIGTSSVGCVSLPALSTITVYALPVVSVAATPSTMIICNNSVLSLTGSGALTYNWNNNATGTTFTSTPSSSSSYFVIGTDVNGCTGSAVIPFTVNPSPALALTGNTFVCLGNSSTLTATGTGVTYSWTATGTASSIVVSPSVTTIYGVTGTNTIGCTSTMTLAVNVNSILVTASSNTAICLNGSANISATGANSYVWSPSGPPFSAITVNPLVTTTYTFVAIDSKACSHTGMITVTVNPLPVVTAIASSVAICSGETATITAGGASTYVWNDPANSTGGSLTVTPTNNTSYVVTGTDTKGCVSTGSVTLTVSKCTGISKVENEIVGLNVYPNPTNGEFTVELNNGLVKTIVVSDLSGRVILNTQTQNDKTVVNLNNFANGVYYVKIQSSTSVEILKVVKH